MKPNELYAILDTGEEVVLDVFVEKKEADLLKEKYIDDKVKEWRLKDKNNIRYHFLFIINFGIFFGQNNSLAMS